MNWRCYISNARPHQSVLITDNPAMKAPSPPGTLLDRRNRKLTSIEPTWRPGLEFVPSSARGQNSARPSAVPSLPSVATPTLKEQLRDKLNNFSFKRSTRSGADGTLDGESSTRNGKGKAKIKEEKEFEQWVPGVPRKKAVMTAAEALGRVNPPATQEYISRVALAQENVKRRDEHGHASSSGGWTDESGEWFSRTIRRPVSAYSPLDPVVSPSDRHIPTPSVLQPRASTRSSMPPPSSRRYVPRGSAPPLSHDAKTSMPPPGLHHPPQNGPARMSMPPLTANGGWAFSPPPSAQEPPPSAVLGYLPHERKWIQQQQQLPQYSPYPPQLSPFPPQQSLYPPSQHSPYPPAQDHQLPPNQHRPQYPQLPPQLYTDQLGNVTHGPVHGGLTGVNAMSPNTVPFSPYPEQGPYLPPIPIMSPMRPCLEPPTGLQLPPPPQVQRQGETAPPPRRQQTQSQNPLPAEPPLPARSSLPAKPPPSAWVDRFHMRR